MPLSRWAWWWGSLLSDLFPLVHPGHVRAHVVDPVERLATIWVRAVEPFFRGVDDVVRLEGFLGPKSFPTSGHLANVGSFLAQVVQGVVGPHVFGTFAQDAANGALERLLFLVGVLDVGV